MSQHIIVIGGSAGAVESLSKLVSQLPADFGAPILVVQHIGTSTASELPQILARSGPLPAHSATDDMPLEPSHIYVAPPDFHLLVADHRIRVLHGPRENRVRPAIDPLFRSAAVSYRSYATGIILSGYLDDGSAGLQAIKRCGGMAMVIDPDQTPHREMPANAIAYTEVDHVVGLAEMPEILVNRIKEQPRHWEDEEIPEGLRLEAGMLERVMSEPSLMAEIGDPVAQSCPSCGGPLWQLQEGPLRFRCHVGHAFTAQALLEENDQEVEQALWVALRTLEERKRMLNRLGDRMRESGQNKLAQSYDERAAEEHQHAMQIRNLITSLRNPLAPPPVSAPEPRQVSEPD